MNDKQVAELAFWKDLYNKSGGRTGFREVRKQDYANKTKYFPELEYVREKDVGLDLGCGMISIFEFSSFLDYATIIATDPLLEEYRKITSHNDVVYQLNGETTGGLYYKRQYGSSIFTNANYFDWIFCINVIDHTPDSEKLIAEMYRVLKKEGLLFFEVNFDPVLTAPHYKLWNVEEVRKQLHLYFTPSRYNISEGEFAGQKLFWGVFKKK